MSRADEYNAKQPLQLFHITAMARAYQADTHGALVVDGMVGPKTREHIERSLAQAKVWPMPKLPDGRFPVVSSDWKGRNKSRPTHNGCDAMYRRLPSDTQPTGPGQGARRFICPADVPIVAAAGGVVRHAGKQTNGWRCWVNHDDGHATGYFHMSQLVIDEGDEVKAGQVLGIVGAGLSGPIHLHFEVSPHFDIPANGSPYNPIDPMSWLEGARTLTSDEVIR